jgi:hypothetical protein
MRQTKDDDGALTLSTGVRIIYVPVNPAVFTEVLSKMDPPRPPMVFIESKGREEQNPLDPTYLAEMDNYQGERANAIMETFALFGVELVEDLPQDDTWLKRLKVLDRLGRLDLSNYDLDDELDLRFLYVKNIAFGPDDWGAVFKAFNVTQEGVATARDGFRS